MMSELVYCFSILQIIISLIISLVFLGIPTPRTFRGTPKGIQNRIDGGGNNYAGALSCHYSNKSSCYFCSKKSIYGIKTSDENEAPKGEFRGHSEEFRGHAHEAPKFRK